MIYRRSEFSSPAFAWWWKSCPPPPRTAGRLLDGEQERQEWSTGEAHAKGSANDDTDEMTGDMRGDQQASDW